MSVTSVQCPNCGAPFRDAEMGTTVCSSCGSTLEIVSGSSGFPMARLAAIGTDTSFVAKSQAVRHLRIKIGVLETERDNANNWGREILALALWGIAVLSLIIGFLSLEPVCVLPAIILVGIGLLLRPAFKERRDWVEEVELELAQKQDILAKLENELDRLAEGM